MELDYLRLLRRKSSFEPGQDVEQIIINEFLYENAPDLSLSVYEVDIDQKLLQTNAEIVAGSNIDIPSKRAGINLSAYGSGWSNVLMTPTTNRLMNFQFTNNAHRELQFQTTEELSNFVQALQARLAGVVIPEVRDKATAKYANEQYLEGNPEWQKVCTLSDKVKAWVTTGKP